jgi:cell division septation protein DedD
MVQIAAVSDQADAQVLLSALHKRGYTVSLRHEPGDSLMHVQIGPFASKADASAMRQKLLNDGYNAILR